MMADDLAPLRAEAAQAAQEAARLRYEADLAGQRADALQGQLRAAEAALRAARRTSRGQDEAARRAAWAPVAEANGRVTSTRAAAEVALELWKRAFQTGHGSEVEAARVARDEAAEAHEAARRAASLALASYRGRTSAPRT